MHLVLIDPRIYLPIFGIDHPQRTRRLLQHLVVHQPLTIELDMVHPQVAPDGAVQGMTSIGHTVVVAVVVVGIAEAIVGIKGERGK